MGRPKGKSNRKNDLEPINTQTAAPAPSVSSSAGLDALFAIEKQFADSINTFKPKKTHVNVISTGSPALDDICVVGGYPRGRIVHLFGPFGGGKTFMCMIAAKSALEQDPDNVVIWFDAENTFDYDWAHNLGIWDPKLYNEETGVDRNRLVVIPINLGKSIFKRISGELKVDKFGKERKDPGFLDLIIEGKLKCPLIVLDSIAAIIPPGEDTSTIGKQNMALLPRFLPPEFRRIASPLFRSETCFMCINQVVTNIGDQWGDEFGFSGGEKLKHWISLNIFVDKLESKGGKILTEKDAKDTIIGQSVRFIIKKSKFGPYPRSCESKVCFKTGTEWTGKEYTVGIVDIEEEWVDLGVHYGVIDLGGSWYSFGDYGKWQGKPNIAEALRADPDMLEALKAGVAAAKKAGKKNDMHVEGEDEIMKKIAVLDSRAKVDDAEEEETEEDDDDSEE